jgi:hypothetical protein
MRVVFEIAAQPPSVELLRADLAEVATEFGISLTIMPMTSTQNFSQILRRSRA